MNPALQAFTLAASGNYRIPIAMALGEKVIKFTVVFADGTTQSLVLDVRSE